MVFFKPTTHPSYEGLSVENFPFNFSSFMRNDDMNNTRLDKEKNKNKNKKQKLQIKGTNKKKPKGNLKDKAETKEKEQE